VTEEADKAGKPNKGSAKREMNARMEAKRAKRGKEGQN
jgi:hypothetical protein